MSTAPGEPRPDGRYRRGDLIRSPVGPTRDLLYRRGTGAAAVVPRSVADAAMAAAHFDDLAAHARSAAAGAGGSATRSEDLIGWLMELVRRGFFVEVGDVVGRGGGGRALGLGTLAVPSGDRPEVLQRTLATYEESFAASGRSVDVVVLDTSRAEANRAANQRALAGLARRRTGGVAYAGPADVERFIAALERAGVDPEVAAFGLLDPEQTGHAYGTARNALLLHCAGIPFLSVDDDVECRTAAAPHQAPGASVFTADGPGYRNYDPHDYWFYGSREEVLADCPTAPLDVMATHEAVLGRPVRDVLGDPTSRPVVLDELRSAAWVERIASGSARALVTFFGLRGDAGMYAPTWHLLKDGASRERLVRSEAAYREACTSRELMRAVPRLTFNDGRFYQTTMMGLDNRALLPPTSPVMRYEDGVFRIMLHRMYEDGMCAFLPWTVLHNRPVAAPWTRDSVWETNRWTRTGEMLVRCVLSADLDHLRHPPARLAAIGRRLVELGRIPEPDFFEFIRVETLRQKAMYVEHLEHLLEIHDHRPAYWADDVVRHIRAFHESASRDDYFVPIDLRSPGRSVAETRAKAQRIAARFGALALEWPAMVEAAAALRESGAPLARAV